MTILCCWFRESKKALASPDPQHAVPEDSQSDVFEGGDNEDTASHASGSWLEDDQEAQALGQSIRIMHMSVHL